MRRILVTTSRMPFALDEIRKLGRAGHELYAMDTFPTAPGNHSRYVRESFVVPSPRYETAAFVGAVEDVVRSRGIDLVIPSFEDGFYLARHRARLDPFAEIFAPDFDVLARLHDKSRFLAMAPRLGLAVPRGYTVEDARALVSTANDFGKFFARPVFSRGGVQLCTNVGPLAGRVPLQSCEPTPEQPWLVQEFVHGTDVCSFSVVHHGEVVAHSTYVHPRTLEHAGGISFESIDESGTLDIARRIAAHTGYHGQLSLDYMRTDRGLVLIECNPRPCGGVYMMPGEMFVEAVVHPQRGRTRCVPAGIQRKVGVAIMRELVCNPRELRENLRALWSPARDVYVAGDDLLPALWVVLSYGHVLAYRWRGTGANDSSPRRSDLMKAYFHDVLWDGEPIADETQLAQRSASEQRSAS